MADKIITRQELVDAQYDAETLGECINGPSNTKVTSRLGRTYWTLATIDYLVSLGLIKIDDLQDAIDIAAAAGAGANGWTDQLIVTSDGKTQKQWNDEVKTYLDNFPFYIPYSSLIDDYADQIELAIQVGRPILFTQDATYVVKRKIAVNSLTKALNITGNNAIIKYDGPADLDRIFEIQHSMPLNHVIYSLEIDANLKASSCLRIYAVEENANGESNFYSNRLKGKNCRKTLITHPGDCIHIRGSFRTVLFEYPEVNHVALAAGAGNPMVSGVSGITVTHYNDKSYPIFMELRGPKISKIFSEDPTYTTDQDGIKFFSAAEATKRKKINSKLITWGGEFINCWGRSIKTQCRDTFVNGTNFTRTEGNADKEGNGEINVQTGNGLVSGATFNYSNGHTGGVCISFDTGADYDNTGGTANGCDVYLDDQTVLPTFISNYPRDGVNQTIIATGNKIHGKAARFAVSLVNGSKNRFVYKDNQVDEIIPFDHGNGDLVKAFHVAKASGAVTPRGSHAELEGNKVLAPGNDVILSLDGIAGGAVNLPISAWNNIGFLDNVNGNHSQSGAKTKQILRAQAFGALGVSTHTVLQNKSIAAGATQEFQLEGLEGGMVFFGLSGAPLSQGILSVVGGSVLLMHSHNIKDPAGVVITNYVNVSNTEPTTPKGIWLDIWRHPDQGGKIVVRNNGTAGRNFNIFQIVM
ncbi:TPA: hypothetical protein MW245_002058 [Acinetobacter baumannii]|nr:hypothetical protein [Acinetobacter baumannii]